jgi:hypothetical protein
MIVLIVFILGICCCIGMAVCVRCVAACVGGLGVLIVMYCLVFILLYVCWVSMFISVCVISEFVTRVVCWSFKYLRVLGLCVYCGIGMCFEVGLLGVFFGN